MVKFRFKPQQFSSHLSERSPRLLKEWLEFLRFLHSYARSRGYKWFAKFEVFKNGIVDILYKKRGRYARPFLHFGTILLIFLVVTLGPVIFKDPEDKLGQASSPILTTATAYAPDFYTLQAEEVRQYRGGEVITHVVREGETLSEIADRYGLQVETILWENDLTAKTKLKPGQELRILPVDGVRHKVARGETIYSIGKKYGLDGSQAQMIVDYPFNEFLNDETFEVAVGQYLMIPEGVKPSAKAPTRRIPAVAYTPDAGSVSAVGAFVWPASGRITQGYRFYHKAIDIANKSGGTIVAADAGVVTVAGWVDGYGYGNRVIIDHGNGYVTLYAHLSAVQVRVGQRVNRGDVIGQMGSTGRSTGVHLHFEIRQGGALLNPLSYLK
ncbi:MAG: peptidoglycan DD-metalloendopeptidase family protein [Candidatus Pacebacteria bacterium]|nr:peptidoglycan DD-metalloendopeptidase family protein [Candidatus Paceibacterota bacterium]